MLCDGQGDGVRCVLILFSLCRFGFGLFRNYSEEFGMVRNYLKVKHIELVLARVKFASGGEIMLPIQPEWSR